DRPVLFLSPSKDQRQVPLRFGAPRATLSRGPLRVFVLLPEALVVSAQVGRSTQPPLQLAAAVVRSLFPSLLEAQVSQFQFAVSFLSFQRLRPLSLFSVLAVLALALPRLARG